MSDDIGHRLGFEQPKPLAYSNAKPFLCCCKASRFVAGEQIIVEEKVPGDPYYTLQPDDADYYEDCEPLHSGKYACLWPIKSTDLDPYAYYTPINVDDDTDNGIVVKGQTTLEDAITGLVECITIKISNQEHYWTLDEMAYLRAEFLRRVSQHIT
jgi:hypothetical protein